MAIQYLYSGGGAMVITYVKSLRRERLSSGVLAQTDRGSTGGRAGEKSGR
jgi:hypothetical protein